MQVVEQEKSRQNAKVDLEPVCQASCEDTLLDAHKDIVKRDTNFRPIIGYLLVVVASFFMCLTSILIKLSFTLNSFDQLFVRYVVNFSITFVICRINHLDILGPKSQRKLLLIRTVFSLLTVFMAYVALSLVDPSDFTIIMNSNVIITIILCRLFLSEKITVVHIMAILFTIMGVMCIFRPKFLFHAREPFVDSNNQSVFMNHTSTTYEHGQSQQTNVLQTIGVFTSIIVACCMGMNQVLLKKLSTGKVHYAVANIYPSFFGIPIAFLISLVFILTGHSHANFFVDEKQYLLAHLFYTVISSVSGTIGILLLIKSFDYEDAAKLTIVKTIDVLFAFILQLLILNIGFDSLGLIGAACILLSVLIVVSLKFLEDPLSRIRFVKIFVTKF
jgi:drug/metabolite transporter (DMT)-like permease